MKRILSVLVFLGIAMLMKVNAVTFDGITQGQAVTIYLNSGSVVKGVVKEVSNASITILTPERNAWTYSPSDVRRWESGYQDRSANDNYVNPRSINSYEGKYVDSQSRDTGFWCAGENVTGLGSGRNSSTGVFEEIDFTGGYRFNEYVRLGVGVGVRYYWCVNGDYNDLRYNQDLAVPIYFTVRGGFMSHAYRTVTPFYAFDTGATVGDGFMVRPAFGIKVGERRSAFILGLGYMGQYMSRRINVSNRKGYFANYAVLKIGYEF